MKTTFYFYDLETSGFNPREARIMQFAGQRTDMNLQAIGEPHNILIKMTDDVLPDPGAILVTGITPQATKADGLTEAEFLEIFNKEVSIPGTIFIGFNTVRFDDEFMRFLQYRNYYDPYEWQWKDERSRWDLLDVVRMTRALRPEGIKWPVDNEGRSSNRLEMLTSINGLDHTDAHDALSDVKATIALAQLLKQKQPKLFSYLLDMRDKKKIAMLVDSNQPFVYSSGKYPSEFEKTTVVIKLTDHPKRQGSLVYDLRHNPDDFCKLAPEEIAAHWTRKWDDPEPRLPVKTLQYNRCPAVAPLGVFDNDAQKRLQLGLNTVEKHRAILRQHPEFVRNLLKAIDMLDKKQQARLLEDEQLVDAQLYDGFFDDTDQQLMRKMHNLDINEQAELIQNFKDNRLKALWPLYKARNHPKQLTNDERQAWSEYKARKLTDGQPSRLSQFFEALKIHSERPGLTQQQHYILEELQLYGESLIPDLGE